MQAPLKDKMVLGVDPAYRTGCKLAVVDQTGKVLKIDKVFITIPKDNYDKEKKILLDIIKTYAIEKSLQLAMVQLVVKVKPLFQN